MVIKSTTIWENGMKWENTKLKEEHFSKETALAPKATLVFHPRLLTLIIVVSKMEREQELMLLFYPPILMVTTFKSFQSTKLTTM